MIFSGERDAMKKPADPPASREDLDFVWSVWQRHRGIIYKTALAHRSEGLEPDEIVNESILILAKNADRLRQLEERPLAVYVAEVVRSAALMLARRERRYGYRWGEGLDGHEDASSGPGAEEAYIERESHQLRSVLLREAMDELSEEDRALLTLKYIKNTGDRQIAELLGLRPGTLRMRLTRARRRARDIIRRREAELDAAK